MRRSSRTCEPGNQHSARCLTGGRVTELQDTVDLLSDTLFSHLAYEERELIEPLARYGFYEAR
jgi:hypothetical protein